MFLIEQDEVVNLNGIVKLTVKQIRTLEPTYPSLPSGYTQRVYYPGKSHQISGDSRNTISEASSWECGDRCLRRLADFVRLKELIVFEQSSEEQVVQEELNKRKPYDVRRKEEYPSIEEMVIALWENLIEKKGKKESGVSNIQKMREAIKDKYPKIVEKQENEAKIKGSIS